MNGRLLALLGSSLLLTSCGETEVFELAFPSVEAFVASETARVYVVPVEEGAVAVCPDLLTFAGSGPPEGAVDTGPVPVCDLRDGGVELPSLDDGLRAYVAIAENTAGTILLQGCTLSDVHADADPVRIALAPTDAYIRLLEADDYVPVGCSVAARCSGACP